MIGQPSLCVKKSYPYLLVLLNSNNKTIRKAILSEPFVVNGISEIVYNILKGNIKVGQNYKKKLRQNQKNLLSLVRKGNQKEKGKFLSSQRGGSILAAILRIAVPILAGVLFNKYGSSGSKKT